MTDHGAVIRKVFDEFVPTRVAQEPNAALDALLAERDALRIERDVDQREIRTLVREADAAEATLTHYRNALEEAVKFAADCTCRDAATQERNLAKWDSVLEEREETQ